MPPRRFTDEEEAAIAQRYLAGESTRAIGHSMGLGHNVIVAALGRQGVTQRDKGDRNRLYKVNPHVFDVIDTEEKAYWLGFIFADGHVARNRTLVVSIAVFDREIAEKLKVFMESESPIKRIVSNPDKKWFSDQVSISFTDQHLGYRLNELGIITDRKRDDTQWRLCFGAVPYELQHHWIRGWFDGDGSAHSSARRGPVLSFCGSEGLLIAVREIMSVEAGTNPNLSVRKHIKSPTYYLVYSGKNVASSAARYLYTGAHVYLQRKKDRVDAWQNNKGPSN